MAARFKHGDRVVVLAHNYQRPEVQDAADFTGDSLKLSTIARDLDCDDIVFCGVDFMAESAKILSPKRRVVIPDRTARCPMAGMIDEEGLRAAKEEHPRAAVVAYVNTTASIKAMSDYCCTSGNAVKVVKAVPEKEIIFVPDKNLAMYVQRFVQDKTIHIWPGYCATHNNSITVPVLADARKAHPGAEVMVHPECAPEVIDAADYVGSTEGMSVHVRESKGAEFIVGTEKEMAYRLAKDNPGKRFHPIECAVCPNMKKTTLQMLHESLRTMRHEVVLPEDVIRRATVPLERMVAIGRG